LLADLRHANKNIRVKTAARIGNSGDKSLAPHLLPLLKDPWGPTAWETYQAIIKLKDVATTVQTYQASSSIAQIDGLAALKSLAGLTPWPNWPKGQGTINLDELTDQENALLCETLLTALKSTEPAEQVIAMIGLKRALPPQELQVVLKPYLRLRINPFKFDENMLAFTSDVGLTIPLLGFPQDDIIVSELAALYLIMAGDEESAKRILKYALEEWWYFSSPKDLMIKCMFDQGWDWVVEKLAAYQEDENINNRLASIACLKIIPAPSVLPILEKFAQDTKRKVRKEAERAIKSWQKNR
jgi:hypothetical protein